MLPHPVLYYVISLTWNPKNQEIAFQNLPDPFDAGDIIDIQLMKVNIATLFFELFNSS